MVANQSGTMSVILVLPFPPLYSALLEKLHKLKAHTKHIINISVMFASPFSSHLSSVNASVV